MSKSYKFIDHTADIAVDLKADSLEELFVAAAEAWRVSVIESQKADALDLMDIELMGNSREELLVNFLNEINFYLVTKKWLCCLINSIKIIYSEFNWEFSAELKGLKLTNEVVLKQEIKSVTYHQMEIVEKNNIYSTRVVFDI